MKKIHNKVMGVNLYAEQFDSLGEFRRTLENTPVNSSYSAIPESFRNSNLKGYDWYMTNSYEEANELMQKGYAEGLRSILKAEGGVKYGTGRPIRREVNNYMGYRPNVPRTLMGLPKSMVQFVQHQPKVKVLSIYYDCSAYSNVTAETLAIGGKNFMTLIRHLEGKGCRVAVYVVKSTQSHLDIMQGRTAVLSVKVKDFTQKLNPLLMSYPMTHPSFFRRHGFRWMEVSEATNIKKFTENSYSSKMNVPRALNTTMQDFLRKAGVIPQNGFYLDCLQVAKCDSINEILELLK